MSINPHRLLLKLISGLVILGGILIVFQIWGIDIINWYIFLRAMGTLAVIIVILGFLLVVKTDFGEHKKMTDENYLD